MSLCLGNFGCGVSGDVYMPVLIDDDLGDGVGDATSLLSHVK